MFFYPMCKKVAIFKRRARPLSGKKLSANTNVKVNDETCCHHDNVNCQKIRALAVSKVCFIYTNISILFSFLFYDKNDIKKE